MEGTLSLHQTTQHAKEQMMSTFGSKADFEGRTYGREHSSRITWWYSLLKLSFNGKVNRYWFSLLNEPMHMLDRTFTFSVKNIPVYYILNVVLSIKRIPYCCLTKMRWIFGIILYTASSTVAGSTTSPA
jgi:hypothetical protein